MVRKEGTDLSRLLVALEDVLIDIYGRIEELEERIKELEDKVKGSS